jgi:hypothetical protein
MPSFRLLHETPPQPIRDWGLSALGLTFAIALTWLLTPALRLHTLSWPVLWIVATRSTIPVLAATAAVVWIAARLLSACSERERIDTALDVACVATWFPPLFIFVREQSPWAVLIAALLAATLTRALLVRGEAPSGEARTLAPAICTAMGLQASVAAMTAGEWRIGALALAAAGVFLTWILISRGIWPHPAVRGRKPRGIRIVPALLLGVSFSAGGLTPYLVHSRGAEGRGGDADGPISALFGKRATQAGTKERELRPRNGEVNAIVPGESWPGVVLWPEVQKYVTLVAPKPREVFNLFRGKQLDSISIPFYGAYWYFKGPGDPPPNMFVTHGDAASLSFRSTDLTPLTMEARQNFGRTIDMSCCSAIGVAIESGERYVGTVNLELELRNSTIADAPWYTLGELPVGRAASQTLKFPLPARLRAGMFDEIQVLFHLLQPRADRSARIALRRFLFLR